MPLDQILKTMFEAIKRFPALCLPLVLMACSSKEQTAHTEHKLPPLKSANAEQFKTLPATPCDGCEIMFLGMPLKLDAVDTTLGWKEEGQKLKIEGTIYKPDGKTPASEVIFYYYHTDREGHYSPREGMLPSARRHGHLRGWVKTGPDGKYAIYTNRPAQYPDEKIEAHIHVFVKEPYLDIPYYIDEWIFDDDPLVTRELRNRLQNRGGSGILKIKKENDVQVANHDIFLGLNIPGYPE